MQVTPRPNGKVCCYTEYDVLKQVVLCEPKHMIEREVMHDPKNRFSHEGIHIKRALKQHRQLVDTLREYGVDVIMLPGLEKYPEQVFTRDIGFVLGHMTFVAEMANDVRKGEEHLFRDWLKKEEVPYYHLLGDKIEGGDVMIDRRTIYIGVSNRTSEEAIGHLQSLLPFEVVAVPFAQEYLHLDCIFNIISPTEALLFRGVMGKEEEALLASRYELIEVKESEQVTLGTNVLSIGNKRILSLPVNQGVNRQLRDRGYEVIEVDITEIIKSGGAFRCCTLPLLREHKED